MAKTREKPRVVRGDDFFESAGVSSSAADYKTGGVTFAQGDPGTTVMFIKKGTARGTTPARSGWPGRCCCWRATGECETPQRVLPKLSQELLAEMIGTTRSRVNFFMNKFRKLGFIEHNGRLKIDGSLLSVVLHD